MTETTEKPKNGPNEKAPEPLVGPQPKAPTPLNPPVIMYNKTWRVPALVVETQEELDGLDPNEWMPDPLAGGAKEKPPEHWPKLYVNINTPPVVVGNAADAAALGSAYHEFAISEELAKSAEASNADKKKQAAKAPAQQPQPQHK